MREIRELTGTVRAESRFTVASKISGRVVDVLYEIGDEVEQGAVVARLEDEEFREEVSQVEAELEVAKAQLEEAESNLELARADLKRTAALREGRLVPEADFDTIQARLQSEEARVRVATATVSQREAALRRARLRLEDATIRANWSGENSTRLVAERFSEPGDTLSANSPILSILQIDQLRASVQVTERDYDRIHVDQPALITSTSLRGEFFEGRVARKAPFFRESSRQALVELEVENRDHLLRPGMFVRVLLELDRVEDALRVPRSAIIRREGRDGVFHVQPEDGTARFLEVRIGFSQGDKVLIEEPEFSGQVVVVGQDQLTDGMPVRVVSSEPPAEVRDGEKVRAEREGPSRGPRS